MALTPVHVCNMNFRFVLRHEDVQKALSEDPDARVWIEIPIKLQPLRTPRAAEELPDLDLLLEVARAEVGLKVTLSPILDRSAQMERELRAVDPDTGIMFSTVSSDSEISGSESESEDEAPEQIVPNGHNADSADTESLPDDM